MIIASDVYFIYIRAASNAYSDTMQAACKLFKNRTMLDKTREKHLQTSAENSEHAFY